MSDATTRGASFEIPTPNGLIFGDSTVDAYVLFKTFVDESKLRTDQRILLRKSAAIPSNVKMFNGSTSIRPIHFPC